MQREIATPIPVCCLTFTNATLSKGQHVTIGTIDCQWLINVINLQMSVV